MGQSPPPSNNHNTRRAASFRTVEARDQTPRNAPFPTPQKIPHSNLQQSPERSIPHSGAITTSQTLPTSSANPSLLTALKTLSTAFKTKGEPLTSINLPNLRQ